EARRNAVKRPSVARWDLPIPIELGTIAAGDWASSGPDRLTSQGRMGVAIGEDVAAARRALEEAVAEASAADPWLRENPVEVQWWRCQFACALTDLEATIIR